MSKKYDCDIPSASAGVGPKNKVNVKADVTTALATFSILFPPLVASSLVNLESVLTGIVGEGANPSVDKAQMIMVVAILLAMVIETNTLLAFFDS
jgi:hypothetical protein